MNQTILNIVQRGNWKDIKKAGNFLLFYDNYFYFIYCHCSLEAEVGASYGLLAEA
jgi:hypothetical protein